MSDEHLEAMPEDYRIMEVGEIITEECMAFHIGIGPWGDIDPRYVGRKVGGKCAPICCPVDSQKQPETSDNSDRGEQATDKPVQDPVKMKLHEYECRAKNAEDEVVELQAKLTELRLRGDK